MADKCGIRFTILVVLLALTLTGCIRPVPSPRISVGGDYATAVSLTNENSCGAVEVQSLPTTITQAPGAAQLTFTHAGNSYQGALQNDGHFATQPTPLRMTGATYTITIQGQFSRLGFDALTTVAVQQNQASATCHYVVHMVGSKQTGENTLPTP